MVVDTDTAVREKLAKAGISQCWIKRGDKHTQHKEDVSYVRRAEEAQELVQEYFLRGIPRAVIQRHPRRRACTVLWGSAASLSSSGFSHASGHHPSGHGDTAVDRAPAEGNGPACGIGTEHTGVRRGMHTVPGRRPAHNRLQRLAIVRPLPRAGIHRHSQVCNR